MKGRFRPKIGLALSGGSVRGLAYIGVLKVLEREKIPVDYVAGTSIGAVIGAFYCAGMHPNEIEDLLTKADWSSLMDFTSDYTGLIDGKNIEKFLRDNLKVKKFENLYIPLVVTSVDIKNGKEVIFDRGDIAHAVRASLSVPGVFIPVKEGKHLLVDGGVLDPIPLLPLKGKVDKIIAVDLSVPYEYSHAKAVDGKSETWNTFKTKLITQEVSNLRNFLKERRRFPRIFLMMLNPKYFLRLLQGKPLGVPPLFRIIMRANNLSMNELIRLKLEKYKPDLVIKPNIKDGRFIEFDKAKLVIKAGEDAALKNIKGIKRLARVR